MPRRDVRSDQPKGIDPARLGEADRPENDWGEPADEGTAYGSNHTRRAETSETARLQGNKTRRATKDQISRRA
jgi:hypothetical protein